MCCKLPAIADRAAKAGGSPPGRWRRSTGPLGGTTAVLTEQSPAGGEHDERREGGARGEGDVL